MTATNPLVTLREAALLTVSELADISGVSVQAIYRNEQGVYVDPSPRYLQSLLESSPVGPLHDPRVLSRHYLDFQKLTREENYGKLIDEYDFSDSIRRRNHPFVQWRLDSGISSRISISKFYCVHPGLVWKFEKQPHLCLKPPGELTIALGQSGYSLDTLKGLDKAYDEYREALRRNTSVRAS